jgi:fumarate reductase flavoprotein subunit
LFLLIYYIIIAVKSSGGIVMKLNIYAFFAIFLFLTGPLVFAKDYNTDIVIVGGGISGMTAALSALESGYSVLVLEKTPFIGGAGNYAEGYFGVETAFQKEQGIKFTSEEAFNNIMNFHHWYVNPEIIKAWVYKTSETYDWLTAHGLKFERIFSLFGIPAFHVYQDGHASSYVKILNDSVARLGGIVLTETPGEKLLFNSGKVTGVQGRISDTDEIINAYGQAIILATGGFAANKEMVSKYAYYKDEGYVGTPGRTGDGIMMAESAGAKLINMSTFNQGGLWLPLSTDEMFSKTAPFLKLLTMHYQQILWVNLKGKRVIPEHIPLDMLSNAAERAGGQFWSIFDDNARKEVVEKGFWRGYSVMLEPGVKFTEFDSQFNEAVRRGFAFKADSLDELARLTKMDAVTLKATVAANNKFFEQGYDEQFFKTKALLRPVSKPPFYAMKTELRMFATLGGPEVDVHMNVLDKGGEPIPGLYATGHDASGAIYGDSYDMRVAPGSTSSFAINSGRMAVDHIKTWLKPARKR